MSRTVASSPPWIVAAWILAAAAPIAAIAADELRFVRVNVAAAAVQDLPLGAGRYVPMPLAEFDELVTRLGAAARGLRQPIASAARYRLTLDATGTLSGRVEFQLDGSGDAVPAEVPLGRVVAERCVVQTAEGTGEAMVFGLADGGVAVRTTGPATYTCDLRLPGPPVGSQFSLPLVPALTTTLELQLPRPLRPIVVGTTAAVVEPIAADELSWRIERGPVGPGCNLAVILWDGRGEAPLVRSWSAVTIRGRQAEVEALLEPVTPWTPKPLSLALPAGMRIVRAVAATDGGELGGNLTEAQPSLEIPHRLVGSREGLRLTAMLPLDLTASAAVPTIAAEASRWGGTNVVLTVDPALAIQRVQLVECRASAPAAAVTWPVPAVPPPPASAGIQPPRLALEYQSPAAEAAVVIGPRAASFDTTRVTTVDISPGTVLGRAAVDLQVVAGRVFGLSAEVAPGWFIDSVEVVEWQQGDGVEGGIVIPGLAPEWRVVRSPRGSELRIGLPRAATPRSSTGLRITGHRAGLPLGAGFSSDDMDMVRFPGETALLEFQVGPTAVLEAVGGELGVEPLPAPLAPLSGLAAPRARIRAGERAPAVRCRLVRRRPPVEAEVEVDLRVRDDRVAETFAFTCRPVAGELDAVVVHFSELMGPDLEWSLAPGGAGTLAAQRLEPGDATRGELRAEPSVAESWLIELRPATTSAVSFRGRRTTPLAAALPVPLAWVEAAERPGGMVTIRSDSGRLPELTNRQLRELPPAADSEAGFAELAYGPPGPLNKAAVAAEIAAPPDTAAARAWVWRQATTCWCHDSGRIEWETAFEIENQGRESVTLTLADGLRVEGVTVAGEAVGAAAIGPEATGLAVPLPRSGGRLKLVVRGSGGRDGQLGWWRVDGVACGIDMPVLDREMTVMIPPGLVLAGVGAAASQPGWASRLFGGGISPPATAAPVRGFTPVVVPDAATAGEAGFVLIRRPLLVSLTVIVACCAVAATTWLARRRCFAAVAVCGAAAVAALWAVSPCDAVARGLFWAAMIGTWIGSSGRSAGSSAAIIALFVGGLTAPPAAADEPPLRVYVIGSETDGTALVPEPLLRRLAAVAVGPPAMRVLATNVAVDPDRGVWQIELELDADRGGGIVLDQGPAAAVWQPPTGSPPGLTVSLDDDGRIARIQASAAGRHRLAIDLVPVLSRVGDLDVATVRLPPAARGLLRLAAADATAPTAAWHCDRAMGQGPWVPAAATTAGWEIASADRVRLVRPIDPRATILAAVRAAVSFNDIAWLEDECRLTATFDVGADAAIIRSLMLRVAGGLEPVAAGVGQPAASLLGPDRYLLEIPVPRAGQQRIVTTFRMPLADPVGVFEVPFVWLESAETDVRTVRLRPAADLEAGVQLPSGMAAVRPREEDGPETTAVWREDVGAAVAAPDVPRPRIEVRRRLQEPGLTQDLAVEFADDHVGLRLRCRLDTSAEPLLEIPVELPPAAIVDRVSLVRRQPADAGRGAAGGGPRRQSQPDPLTNVSDRIDLVWSRESADRIVAVVQRPDVGRFEMQLDARLPIRPASRGRLPVARLAAAELPLEISWRAAAGMSLEVVPAEPAAVLPGGRTELGPGASGPAYMLSREPRGEAEPEDPGPSLDSAAVNFQGEPFTAVDLSVDGLGRAWGLVRFDLVAREPVLTLVLPAGLRLFDVRADGRELAAKPAAGNSWEVRLHDVGWPRTLVAVFSGPLGSRLADGQAIRLEPPRLAGLPAGPVVWSLAVPEGMVIRVSEPARILAPDAFAALKDEERRRFDEAFRLAVRQSAGSLRDRLDAFAATRRANGSPAGERSWYEALRAVEESAGNRTLIEPDADGTLTIRAVRSDRATISGRGLATAMILALGLACWIAARRFPDRCRQAVVSIRRWWWVGCGAVWIAVSQTLLPGGLLLAIGLWLAWPRRVPAVEAPTAAAVGGSDATLSYVPK